MRACSPLSRKKPPRRSTLRPLGSPRGSPRQRGEDAPHRFLQPTFTTRAPENRPTPEPATLAAKTASAPRVRSVSPECVPENGVGPPFSNPAPSETALDGATPASANPLASLREFAHEETCLRAKASATLPRLYRPRPGTANRPLTHPVAPRIGLDEPDAREAPGPLPPLPRQQERLPRSGAPSTDKCSRALALASGSPPPCSRLCRPRASFRRSFTPACALARGG